MACLQHACHLCSVSHVFLLHFLTLCIPSSSRSLFPSVSQTRMSPRTLHVIRNLRTRTWQQSCPPSPPFPSPLSLSHLPNRCIWRCDTEYTCCPVLHLPLLFFDSSPRTQKLLHTDTVCVTTDVSLCSCHGIQLFGWWAVSLSRRFKPQIQASTHEHCARLS